MREARPVEPPDWVLKGGLAQVLAPPLGLRPTIRISAGLMQITHKNHRLSRIYRPNPSEALRSASQSENPEYFYAENLKKVR